LDVITKVFRSRTDPGLKNQEKNDFEYIWLANVYLDSVGI